MLTIETRSEADETLVVQWLREHHFFEFLEAMGGTAEWKRFTMLTRNASFEERVARRDLEAMRARAASASAAP